MAGGIKLGGATTFLLNLGGEFVRRGIPVLVVSLEYENPHAADFERLKIPVHVEDERKNIFEDRLTSVLGIIREFNPTTVVSCLGESSYEVLRYVPRQVQRLAMLQSDFDRSYEVLGRYAPFLDATIGVSQEICRKLSAQPNLGGVRSHYLAYGVPIPKPPRPRNWTTEEPIKILYLGRVCRPQKRVHLFPEIFHQLKDANISFEWTIAGEGPELSILQKQMQPAGKAIVRFTGAVAYAEVPALYDANEIFLLASDHEGLPLSLLEAMAHGLVPVVSDLPSGIREVVDERNGVRVAINDLAGFASAIVQFSENRDELAVKSERSIGRVAHDFSVSAMANRWLELMDSFTDRLDESEAVWPQKFDIAAPLGSSRFWFCAPARLLRRLLKKRR